MGSCSSGGQIEGGLISDQEVHPEHPVQTEAKDSTMGEQSDFNNFFQANNRMLKMAKEKYHQYDDLRRSHDEMQKKNDGLTAEIETLRQRYVLPIFCKVKTTFETTNSSVWIEDFYFHFLRHLNHF